MKQVVAVRWMNFSLYSVSSVLMPYLPLYFRHKGYNDFEIGLFMMIGPFVSMFFQPMWGYVSDRFNTTKKIIALLWICTVISSVGLFFTGGFWFTLLFVLLLYFFMNPSMPLMDSLTIKSAAKAGLPYGSVRLWGSLGFSLSTFCSGYVLLAIGGVMNLHYIYYALWILPFTILLFLRDEQREGPRVTLQSLRSIGGNRKFLWFLGLMLLISVPHRMNDVMLGIHMTDLGAPGSMVGLAWMLAALSEIPTFALLSRYIHRYHELALLGMASALYIIRWLCNAFITDPAVLAVMQLSHSVTFAVLWIVAVQYAVKLVPEDLRTTGQSLLSAVFLGLAGLTGGAVGGWIKDLWGGQYAYMIAALLSAAACVLFFATHAYHRRKEAR